MTDLLAEIGSELRTAFGSALWLTPDPANVDALETARLAASVPQSAKYAGPLVQAGGGTIVVLLDVRGELEVARIIAAEAPHLEVFSLHLDGLSACTFLNFDATRATAWTPAEALAARDRLLDRACMQARRVGGAIADAPAVATDAPFRFLRPWQLAELPPRRLLWGAGLGVGELGLLFGPWGSCKSFLALALGVAVADGTEFLGQPVTQGLALFIVGEGESGQADRLRAATAASRMANRDDPMHELLGTACVMPPLTDAKGFDAVVAAIEARQAPPALLVLDTVARALCAAGLDENATSEMGLFVAAADRLRARFPGMAVLLVHHTGNDRLDRARGSIVLPSACDFVMHVEPVRAPGLPRVKLVFDKVKDGEKPAPLVVNFASTVVRDSDRGHVTSLRVDGWHYDTDEDRPQGKRETAKDRIRAALIASGPDGIDFDGGKKASTKTGSTVSEALARMVQDGEAEPFTGSKGEKRWRPRQGGNQ